MMVRAWLLKRNPENDKYPRTRFVQHPENPLPFYVLDASKIHDNEKLEWIRGEIGVRRGGVDTLFSPYHASLVVGSPTELSTSSVNDAVSNLRKGNN